MSDLIPPRHAGELIPFRCQVLLNARGRWVVQRSTLNCNRLTIWKLLTEPPLHKIHALKILESINSKNATYYTWNAETNNWVEREASYFGFD